MFLFMLMIVLYLVIRLFRMEYYLASIAALFSGAIGSALLQEKAVEQLVSWQYWVLDAVGWAGALFLLYFWVIGPILRWISGKTAFPWAFWKKSGAPASNGICDSPRNDYSLSRPRYSFKDVMGMEDLKRKLREAVYSIKSNGKNGILLTGEPGNGKTFIAEALAGEIGLPFMPITYGDVASKWINQTTEQVVAAFDAAERAGSCVLFLDEIDSLIKDRNSTSGGHAEQMQTTNAILTKLVDLRGSGVIIVAASNYPDLLDQAATREGRFDFKIKVPPPDFEARFGLLGAFMEKGLTYSDGVRERTAKRWEGFSLARIRSVVEVCSKEVKKQGRMLVELDDMRAALREVQGSAGEKLAENTKSVEELSFPEKEKRKLLTLAKRMVEIDEVERLGGTVPKGVLFFGPPGTGKTATAKGLAKSSGWAFISTTGQALLSAPEKVDEILKKAADIRPCIVFIDEADDVLQDRGGSGTWGKASTNKLLAAMDGVGSHPDVMFVAATNHPEILDAAAVRGGRFSEWFEFGLPDLPTVQVFIAQWIAGKRETPFGTCFTPETAAKILFGFSLADVQDRLQRAVNQATDKLLSGGKVEIGDLEAVLR